MKFAFSLGPWLCVPAFRQVCPLVNIHFPNNKYSTTALVLQSYIKNDSTLNVVDDGSIT